MIYLASERSRMSEVFKHLFALLALGDASVLLSCTINTFYPLEVHTLTFQLSKYII